MKPEGNSSLPLRRQVPVRGFRGDGVRARWCQRGVFYAKVRRTGSAAGCGIEKAISYQYIAGSSENAAVKANNYSTLDDQANLFTFRATDVKFVWANADKKIRGTTGVMVGACDATGWHFYYSRPGYITAAGHVYRITHNGLVCGQGINETAEADGVSLGGERKEYG